MKTIRRYFTSLDKWDIGLMVICLGFYLFFPFYDGPIWCKDSPSYATMNISREPLYPTFLWICRRLFKEEGYQMAAVIVQSVIAAYASWKLAFTVKRYNRSSNILAVLSVCFQFGVTILCRFVAIRGSSYIDSMMTEGLGLSFYVLFIVQLYRYIIENKKRNLIGTAVFALLLVCLRKQMLITLCLMAAVFMLYYLVKERKIKKLMLLLAMICVLLVASKMADRLYNYCVRGAFIEHSGNSMGMLCTLIYTSDASDETLFADETLKEMFKQIWKQADEQRLRMTYAPDDWEGLSSHYADSYDAIGYGIINPVVQGHITENFHAEQIEAALRYDEYCGAMTKALTGQEKGDLIRVYLANTFKGFINSVARVNRVLNLYAVLVYLIFGVFYLLAVKRKSSHVLTFAEIVIGGVIINSLVVGAMIFCQPRYMIYNMGLFYSALSVLLYDFIYADHHERHKGEAGRWRICGKR